VRFKPKVKGSNKIEFKLKGPLEFIARHIQESTADFDIINQDHHIATLNKNAELYVTLKLGYGIGYIPSEDNKDPEADLQMIPIDSIYTPVKNVKYDVLYTRVGQKIDYEKLVMEIATDGTITAVEALTNAAKILRDHLGMFIGFDRVSEERKAVKSEESEFNKIRKMLLMNVDELKLSVRAQNCLRSANIKTLSDLVRHQEVEMLQFRNFGRKSLAELGEILQENGLSFGMDVDKYLNEE
ncbi:MAG: DNA-directed RNA polymerase subunit alpha, partial [Ignavibacteria bacterium]